jgi:hypothetical protein
MAAVPSLRRDGTYPPKARTVHPMRPNRCCKVASHDFGHQTTKNRIRVSDRQRPALVRRLLENAGWMVPGAILALLPKCPACVATYALIGTGIGFSLSATTYLRTLLVIMCLVSLSYLAARGLRRFAATIFTTQAKNNYECTGEDIRSIAQSLLSPRSRAEGPRPAGAAMDHGMGAAPGSVH